MRTGHTVNQPPLSDRQIVALKSRIDLPTFCKVVYPPWLDSPHLGLILTALREVSRYIETRGAAGIGRLRIELPPRHGKSQLVARLFPSWMLGRTPSLRIILASHGAQLSEGHSRYIRNTIRGTAYQSIFPRARLSDDSQSREAWDMAEPYNGGLLAVGTGGSVTGRGAGLLLCDDLVKSREEVESAAARDKLWEWYVNDLLTRQEPAAAIIHIGTRWHLDDLLGRLDSQEPEGWHVIRLPALAEENDPLGREPGAALWPARFDRPALLEQRASMGDYSFQALYQQQPVAASGGIFHRAQFNIIDSPPSDLKTVVRFWDLALSEKTTADYTVGAKLGLTDSGRFVVLGIDRFRLTWKAAQDRIVQTALLDGPKVQIGVEKVLFQVAAVEELIRRPVLHDYSIKGYAPHGDKLTRSLPFAARVDAGMVDVVRGPWTQDFIDELCSFASGKHDDQVDAATGAYTMLGVKPPIKAITIRYA